ncbi:MAG: hypothetical protein DBW97_02485 [SAR86 cluster bacterium]|uniref:DUF2066 domain-containing protein n=1 Tax=SAR86 cluster bacterium TaxID=2030880 RepID=A0A368BNG8_9GAMM|nr:MAG: hypothetical protein DBW97_02485 [SAR86 cluster bacterium]|tara:strand:- start:2596 stop:3531 length:936 start_codon:yes stop_codon:yes gene_type:complete
MDDMSLTRFLRIALAISLMSFNCFGQSSNNFLLIYEDYENIKNIENLIQNVDEKIFTKYGVNLDSIASSTDLDAQRFFIGYQVRVFDDVRLIELKFNKEKIEEYFLENSIPFLANTSDVKIYIAINDAFLPMNNTFVYESGEFQKELEVTKLLAGLNQNVRVNFELIDNYPRDEAEEKKLIADLENMNIPNWNLLMIDRFDLSKWSFKFPKSNEILISDSMSFQNILSRNLFYTLEKNVSLDRNSYSVKFSFDLSKEELTELLETFLTSTEILSFHVSSLQGNYIEIKYDSYLDEEEINKVLNLKGLVATK